jgi:hypothetical protein
MSQLPTQPVRLDDEQRLELVARSARTERANRPKILLIVGVLAVVAALVYMLMGLSKVTGAKLDVAREKVTTDQIVELMPRVLAFKSAGPQGDALNPDPRMLGKIQALAGESGLTGVTGSESDDTRAAPPGFARKRYTFKIGSQVASGIFAWLARVAKDQEGVELTAFTLTPGQGTPDGQPRWNADVTFVRLERKP